MPESVELGLSTSMVQSDLSRLALLAGYPATHVEIGFSRAEAFPVVLDAVRRLGYRYGFHDPLPWDPRWRWPSLTDPDPAEQHRSLSVMAQTVQTTRLHGADYTLVHFPSVHLGPVAGWSWRQALQAGHRSAALLAHWADELGRPILLENVGPNRYWDAASWIEILEAYPQLAFCLDLGHLYLELDEDRRAMRHAVERLAPYTRQVHVYNATRTAYATWHHVPAHPEQDPADGWIDLPEVLGLVAACRSGPLRIIFEHTPQYPASQAHILEGMSWVRELLAAPVRR
jgi:sugar phosphate isomerase/epimerase